MWWTTLLDLLRSRSVRWRSERNTSTVVCHMSTCPHLSCIFCLSSAFPFKSSSANTYLSPLHLKVWPDPWQRWGGHWALGTEPPQTLERRQVCHPGNTFPPEHWQAGYCWWYDADCCHGGHQGPQGNHGRITQMATPWSGLGLGSVLSTPTCHE